MGFGAPRGQNLAFPITLASRFYNSLYYRTRRENEQNSVVRYLAHRLCQLLAVFLCVWHPCSLRHQTSTIDWHPSGELMGYFVTGVCYPQLMYY